MYDVRGHWIFVICLVFVQNVYAQQHQHVYLPQGVYTISFGDISFRQSYQYEFPASCEEIFELIVGLDQEALLSYSQMLSEVSNVLPGIGILFTNLHQLGENFAVNLSHAQTKESNPHLHDYAFDVLIKNLKEAYPMHSYFKLSDLQKAQFKTWILAGDNFISDEASDHIVSAYYMEKGQNFRAQYLENVERLQNHIQKTKYQRVEKFMHNFESNLVIGMREISEKAYKKCLQFEELQYVLHSTFIGAGE